MGGVFSPTNYACKEKEKKRVIRFNNATLRPALPRLRNKNEMVMIGGKIGWA